MPIGLMDRVVVTCSALQTSELLLVTPGILCMYIFSLVIYGQREALDWKTFPLPQKERVAEESLC